MKTSSRRRWLRIENRVQQTARYKTAYGQGETTRAVSEDKVTYESDFCLEIDLEAIISDLAQRAANNRKGVAKYLGGLVKVSLLPGSTKEISRERKENPWPEGYEVKP